MASYLPSATRLARHYRRSPDQISAREVQDFLVFLQQHEGLHWGTCNTIRHGVRFFFRITLERPVIPGSRVSCRQLLPARLGRRRRRFPLHLRCRGFADDQRERPEWGLSQRHVFRVRKGIEPRA